MSAADGYAVSYGHFGASVEQTGGGPRTAELSALAAVDDVHSATFVFGGVAPEGGGLEDAAGALVFAGSHEAFGGPSRRRSGARSGRPGEFAATRSFLADGASLGDRFDLWVIPQEPAAQLGFDAADQAVRLLTGPLVGASTDPRS